MLQCDITGLAFAASGPAANYDEVFVKTVMVQFFQSLDNYGTGMMGLVALDRLQKALGEPITAECDFFPSTDIAEIQDELGADEDRIRLRRYVRTGTYTLKDKLGKLVRHIGASDVRGRDMVIVLGGDDLSEYYSPDVWKTLIKLRLWAFHAPIVLLGQTAGPFNMPRNRIATRALFPKFHMFPRDQWCTQYLHGEFGLTSSVIQSADLAFSDLPRQHDKTIEREVLTRYGLEPDGYATVVVSAMQKTGYYTKDDAAYLDNWRRIAEGLLKSEALAGRKLCLLAHTFSDWYGHEPDYIERLLPLIDPALHDRVVPIGDRVLQTRARFLLGNGRFTITGRMHPAISTFQMGKPAISLSYSKKYQGIIGTMLGRSDLIIEANDPQLWARGDIVRQTLAKADYVVANEDRLRSEIVTAVDRQKAIIDDTFDRLRTIIRS